MPSMLKKTLSVDQIDMVTEAPGFKRISGEVDKLFVIEVLGDIFIGL